jgi:hypothetical protein
MFSQSLVITELLVRHPFTMGTRPQLIVVSGLSVGIPSRWDLGHNLLLSQAFRWESLWRWDLGHNFLSQAFRWESLWRWDLSFHGAFGYHRALSQTFLSHDGTPDIKEPFHKLFLFLNRISAPRLRIAHVPAMMPLPYGWRLRSVEQELLQIELATVTVNRTYREMMKGMDLMGMSSKCAREQQNGTRSMRWTW